MKRFFFAALALLCVLTAAAQDIIVTTDAKRINAKIIEVSAYDILYRASSDVDGPTFRLPLTDIVSILFEDGRVSVFKNRLSDPELYDKVVRQPLLPGLITKQDKKHYLLTEDNQVTNMSEQAYLRFIENNCPEAWQSYQRGQHLWSLGWRFFGAGMCLEAVGIPVFFLGARLANDNRENKTNLSYGTGMKYAGEIMMIGGGACTVASIPLLSVGSHRRSHSHEVYNDMYLLQHPATPAESSPAASATTTSNPPLVLSLQSTTDGLGLSLSF